MKKLFNSNPKYLYVGNEEAYKGFLYSELSSPYKEGEEWKLDGEQPAIFMMSRERHEQIDSRQKSFVKVDFGSLSDLDNVSILGEDNEEISDLDSFKDGLGGIIWEGSLSERDKQFKKLGK